MKHTCQHAFQMVLCLLICTLLLCVLPVRGEEEIYGDVIRLHIIAASDSEEDQALKLRVRDAVLDTYGSALTACSDCDAAETEARRLLPETVDPFDTEPPHPARRTGNASRHEVEEPADREDCAAR